MYRYSIRQNTHQFVLFLFFPLKIILNIFFSFFLSANTNVKPLTLTAAVLCIDSLNVLKQNEKRKKQT